MKTGFLIIASGLIFMAFNAAHADSKHEGHEHMQHEVKDKDKLDHSAMKHGKVGEVATGVGIIHKIDADKRVINLTHEPMPELGWPTMTMDLPATKHIDISSFKAGDRVQFNLKLGRDKKYRIMKMETMKPVEN